MNADKHRYRVKERTLTSWLLLVALALSALSAGVPVAAQGPKLEGASLPEAVEAIQHARVTTRILYVIAHPDDEGGSIGLLAYLSRGLGAEVAILSITRGEGGQNAIGPEYGGKLAILRSEELLAACRQYGIGLFFTRAPDFGYSKTPDETMKVWGIQVVEDMVHVIQTFRPHIVINNWGGVRGGHGHHVASGLLTTQVFEEIRKRGEGWQPSLLLQPTRGTTAGEWTAPSDQVSPLWGKTYNEIGVEGFINHRTQGIVGFRNSPFFRSRRGLVRIAGAEFKPEMLAEPLASLTSTIPQDAARFAEAEKQISAAMENVRRLDWPKAAVSLAAGGRAILSASYRQWLTEDAESENVDGSSALWELGRIRRKLNRAIAAAVALQIDARADRSEIVAGEPFTVRLEWQYRREVPLAIESAELVLPEGWQVTKEEKDGNAVRFTVAVPADAKTPNGPDGWMYPEPAPLVKARVKVRIEDYAFEEEAPVKAVRTTSTRVDEVPPALVPAVTLMPEPRSFVFLTEKPGSGASPAPAKRRQAAALQGASRAATTDQRELLVRVHYYGTSPAEFAAGVEAPPGWQVSPAQTLKFEQAGDELVKFTVTPPPSAATGSYELRAWARRAGDGAEFRTSLEPLPSLPTRLWSEPAVVPVRVVDLAVPANLRVGYIAAQNDPIPDALRQIGVHVELLDEVALAFGDLSRFDAIAVGIRAYELRDDLIRSNQRLLDYVAGGGTLVVQYQRESDWNRLKPAPYPASVGQPTIRVSVEDSPVRLLVPQHPVVNFPNKIAAADFDGWVQERGLYFWDTFDARCQPILGMHDPGEAENTGGLVYARHGKGVYIYTGLSFFRQLPEGVPGAFRLFVNLLSQTRVKPSS